MRFDFSVLKDFRSFRIARFDWGPRMNLVLGPNGVGKTNLLESLNILTGWGPFSGRTRGAIRWDFAEGGALLRLQAGGEERREVRARISSRMTLYLDGKGASSTDLRLTLPSLTFLPTDIGLIDGSPSVRRRFLDRLCALYHPLYARRLAEFGQVSRGRSALLRQGRPVRGTTLPFARLGGWIMEARRHVAARLLALKEERALSGLSFSFGLTPELDQGGADYLLAALEGNEERERYAQRPLVGPGHDDLEITSGGRPAAEALSRGQKRRVVLSLILMAGRLVELQLRRSPILLFDDLAAELDSEGRAAAARALFDTGWQVIVTGTEDPFAGLGVDLGELKVQQLASGAE